MQRFKWPLIAAGCVLALFVAGVLIGSFWGSDEPSLAQKRRAARRETVLRAPISTAPPAETLSSTQQNVTAPRRGSRSLDASLALLQTPPPGTSQATAQAGRANPLLFSSSSFNLTERRIGPGNGETLLVMAGMHGDEPGAYLAAALLASGYSVSHGSLRVVPDANFASILAGNKGLYGDMDGKLLTAPAGDDPDYDLVQRIASIIDEKSPNLVLDLHDAVLPSRVPPVGSAPGTAPKSFSSTRGSDEIVSRIERDINLSLGNRTRLYRMYDDLDSLADDGSPRGVFTHAVRNGKTGIVAAADKELSPEERACAHLQAAEALMRQMGIRYERNFPLTPEGVALALQSGLQCGLFDGRVVIPLENVRPSLRAIPFRKSAYPDFRASRPLVSLVPEKNKIWRIASADRTLTRLHPQVMQFDSSLQEIDVVVDGVRRQARLGEIVPVAASVGVSLPAGYRLKAVGVGPEATAVPGALLTRADFTPEDSVDRDATLFRLEIYRNDAFAGMVLIRFPATVRRNIAPLPGM